MVKGDNAKRFWPFLKDFYICMYIAHKYVLFDVLKFTVGIKNKSI